LKLGWRDVDKQEEKGEGSCVSIGIKRLTWGGGERTKKNKRWKKKGRQRPKKNRGRE